VLDKNYDEFEGGQQDKHINPSDQRSNSINNLVAVEDNTRSHSGGSTEIK